MMQVTCKCGQTTVTFQHLSEKDFPDGFEDACCKDAMAAILEVAGELDTEQEPKDATSDTPERSYKAKHKHRKASK